MQAAQRSDAHSARFIVSFYAPSSNGFQSSSCAKYAPGADPNSCVLNPGGHKDEAESQSLPAHNVFKLRILFRTLPNVT